MRAITFIALFILAGKLSSAQNIFTALQLKEQREYKTKRPLKIEEKAIFYRANGSYAEHNIKTFDNAGMLLMEERYGKDETLTARLTYTNDTVNRLILSRVFERWTSLGITKETAFFTYDSNHFLLRSADKNADGTILRQAVYICNEKGDPVEISMFNGNGDPIGKETATYNYGTNKLFHSVISNDGRIRNVSSDSMKISFKNAALFPGPGEVYNAKGDLVSHTSTNNGGGQTITEEEYTYDEFGNCPEQRIYKIKIGKDGERKREKDRVFKKIYTY